MSTTGYGSQRAPRHHRRMLAMFSFNGSAYHSARTLDVSRTGLSLATRQQPEIGTRLELTLGLPGDEQVHVLAEVVRRRAPVEEGGPGELGLRIIDSSVAYDAFLFRLSSTTGLTAPQLHLRTVPVLHG